MTRWTVRNVEAEAVQAVQGIAMATGVTLGESLSAAIRHGAGAALQELKSRDVEFDLVEAVERIQQLQHAFSQTLRSLYDTRKGHIATAGTKSPKRLRASLEATEEPDGNDPRFGQANRVQPLYRS